MSTKTSPIRKRLSADERRAEIAEAAARIGIGEGLERITLRSVAEAIGVRPGLIHHYFPEAEGLVATAFSHAAAAERPRLFRDDVEDTPSRMVAFLDQTMDPESLEVGRLWLNARNLSRYNASLRHALAVEEQENNSRLVALIEAGVEDGSFVCEQPARSALLVLILVDALTGYSNEEGTESTPLVAPLIFATAEKELGLPPGSLSSRSTQLPGEAETSEAPASEAPASGASDASPDALEATG